MKKLLLAATLAAAVCVQAGTPAEDQLLQALPGIFEKSGAHYRALLEAMKAQPPDSFPKRFQDGKLVAIKPRDWCSGVFPGSLWYLYEYTKDDFWKEQAVAYTERLIEPLRHDASNHDVGFRTYCSAGNGLRLTGDKRYAEFLHDTSAALRTRFDDNLGLIRSWNSPKKGGGHFGTKYIVIIDNMMNLELLEWDAKNGGDPKSDKIARSQADIT
ncbi:MAG: glucuronyl hydrolase, partial [Kiritimatiellae bacterium]|nr:glucuronyl hydrolase [Kiritimatiellia bacterium]